MHSHLRDSGKDIIKCGVNNRGILAAGTVGRSSVICRPFHRALYKELRQENFARRYGGKSRRLAHGLEWQRPRLQRLNLPTSCVADGISCSLALPRRLISGFDFKQSRHDAEIFRLALPALCSTLLDPLMGLVDTGMCCFYWNNIKTTDFI
jgi:hypothetical protein